MAEFAIKAFQVTGKAEVGDIVFSCSQYHSERRWVEMIIRGTHDLEIPFIPEIYNKYYTRLKIIKISRKPVVQVIANPEENFRVANKNAGRFTRFVDKERVKIETPVQNEILKDIKKYNIKIKHASGRNLIECYPFGTRDLKRNLLLFMPDRDFRNMNEIAGYYESAVVERQVVRKFKIDFYKHRQVLGLDKKVGQVKNSKIKIELKTHLDLNFLDSEKLIDILLDDSRELPNLFQPVSKKLIEVTPKWQQTFPL